MISSGDIRHQNSADLAKPTAILLMTTPQLGSADAMTNESPHRRDEEIMPLLILTMSGHRLSRRADISVKSIGSGHVAGGARLHISIGRYERSISVVMETRRGFWHLASIKYEAR